jgi:peptide-methionine (S)-S-oxide reductase
MEAFMYGALRIDPFSFPAPEVDLPADGKERETAVIAGGCFWCTEAVYREVDGVLALRSGYAGGTKETADYRSVCSGTTKHAEALDITYDPRRLSYGTILKLFFSIAHDPTQLNRQGNDHGPQYRSAIFYKNAQEKSVAEAYIAQIERDALFSAPIVTTLEPLTAFYEAEDYHQDYAARNPSQPYIAQVSAPKVKKLRQSFGNMLKKRS